MVLVFWPGWASHGEAFDALDGIEEAAALKPDLIIWDCQMPRLNGIESSASFKREPGGRTDCFVHYPAEHHLESNVANLGIRAVLSKMDG